MKVNQSILMAIVLGIIVSFSSCKKDDAGSGNNNNNTANPVAAIGTVVHNGNVYVVKKISCYGKYKEGSYSLEIDCSTVDSIIVLYINSASYLPATGTYDIANNIMPLAAGKTSWSFRKSKGAYYYQETSLINQSGSISITNANNEIQFVANNSQGFNMSAQAAGKISFNVKKVNPTIPIANSNFTEPTGMDASKMTIGSSITWDYLGGVKSISKNSNNNCEVEISTTSSPIKNLLFSFADGLPVSGTYDVVASEANVTPGKVYVSYSAYPPNLLCESKNGGQVTVVNTNGVVKVYAKNLSLKNGAVNEDLNAFLTF